MVRLMLKYLEWERGGLCKINMQIVDQCDSANDNTGAVGKVINYEGNYSNS